MKLRTIIFLFAANCPLLVFSQQPDSIAIRFANTITAEDTKKHLSVLASDEYEGRETGKEGQKKAAKYIAEHFKKIGLKPATDDSYFQKFPVTVSTPESVELKIGQKKFEAGKDFYIFPYGSDLSSNEKSILFLGYGISDEKYDDYKDTGIWVSSVANESLREHNPSSSGADTIAEKDKIILILEGEPMNKDSVSFITGTKDLSEWTTNYRKKNELAKRKGAAALLVVNDNFDSRITFLKHYLESPFMKLSSDITTLEEQNEANKKMLNMGMSQKMANEIFASEKTTVDIIKEKIRETKKPFSFEIKTSFGVKIKNREDKITSENVLGIIDGNEFKDEVIFITAHYDHLGVHDGKVFNGADDDGSGTVAVMEIAKAFAKAKEEGFAPKRTIVFMTVAGEEKGLLGSSYYTENPVFPIANTVCDLNIDMIGRIDDAHNDSIPYVYIIGSDKISTDLHKINENANSTYTHLNLDYKFNDINDPNRFYYRSDHYNFAKKGVPVIFYFNGTHNDYHKETDEIDKINFDLLVKRAQLVFFTAWEVANRKERIEISDPTIRIQSKKQAR